jgi:hypothetical protein
LFDKYNSKGEISNLGRSPLKLNKKELAFEHGWIKQQTSKHCSYGNIKHGTNPIWCRLEKYCQSTTFFWHF